MNFNPFYAGNPSALGQQTAAAQLITVRAPGGGGVTRKRRASKKRASKARRASPAKRARSRKGARMVKGSAAAKAYMAKIRRKRRK